MATMATWHPAGGDARALVEARLQAHHAAQWLARAARAYVPMRPDDGHTNLGWDAAFEGFLTHSFRNGMRAGLKIPDLTLTLADARGSRQAFPLNARTDADARAWLGDRLTRNGLDPTGLDEPSPYDIGGHPVAQGAVYQPARLAQNLRALASWYSNAQMSLGTIRTEYAARGIDAPPVRCWPHHFDLDTLMNVAPGKSVGAGFSPGDEYYSEPYFYVGYPEGAWPVTLPAIGHWHTREFTAAIALASRVAATKDPQAEAEKFLSVAVDGAIKALG